MCAAMIYWANIGRMVYDTSNEDLAMLVGENAKNFTMEWTCRDIFKGAKKDIQAIGPVGIVSSAVIELSRPYWRKAS